MYLEHFELKEAPFSITPDPRFVHLTDQHRDALAHLLFGVTQGGGGGFVQLTGEVGTGKTTLCRLLMAQVPENVRIALVLNPMLEPVELLRTICDELRVKAPERTGSIKALTDALTAYLLEAYAAGLRVVVVVDEAQNLSFEALEQLRLLTNLETPTQKLLQIILLGQPELRELLAREELRQLAQRITARFHLAPLSQADTAAYVDHRLTVAGRRRALFTPAALRELFRRTGGFPRSINVVADRALLGGYARGLERIEADMVAAAAREIAGAQQPARFRGYWLLAIAVAIAAISIPLVLRSISVQDPAPQAAAVVTAPSPPATVDLATLSGFTGATEAMAVVAGWWASDAPAAGERCSTATAPGALCAHLRLNSTLLRVLDRPLAIEVSGADGRSWYALRRIDGDAARLASRQRLATVDWTRVESRWVGEAFLVVARPDGYRGDVIAPGSDLPIVAFVHEALTAFDGAVRDGPIYDEADAVRVRAIQDRFGLAADGLIGPETMALLVAGHGTGPTLTERDHGAFVSAPQP